MKKIIVNVLVLGFMTLSLQAYDQVERIQDMQTMEAAMAQIQKGVLYNNKKMALQGVENLKKASSKVEVAPKGLMDYSTVFAKKQAANIVKYSDKMKSNIEANQKHAAATNYTKVLSQCISCHNKIRKWSQ